MYISKTTKLNRLQRPGDTKYEQLEYPKLSSVVIHVLYV